MNILVNCQSEYSCAHWMVIYVPQWWCWLLSLGWLTNIDWVRSPISLHDGFLVRRSTPDHIPFKYRCPQFLGCWISTGLFSSFMVKEVASVCLGLFFISTNFPPKPSTSLRVHYEVESKFAITCKVSVVGTHPGSQLIPGFINLASWLPGDNDDQIL